MLSMIPFMRCARMRLVMVLDSRDFSTDISNRKSLYTPDGRRFNESSAVRLLI
jgi:hypothetical protein